MITDIIFETPKEEPTSADRLAAERLGIPAEAMGYIMETWTKAAEDTLWPERGVK